VLRILKTAAAGLADRFGYTILPNWQIRTFELVYHLRNLFNVYDVACVIDVGANTGQFAQFIRSQVGFAGPLISIEPVPECFERLKRDALTDPDWIVVNAALGAIEEERTFNVMANRALSSFLEPHNDRLPQFARGNTVERTISLRTRRLDELLTELENTRRLGRIYLKLDTQGYDLEVMKGVGERVAQIAALQSEISVLPLYEGLIPWHEGIKAFKEYGFELSGLWPVNRTPQLEVIEFDCVMVRPTQYQAELPP